MTKALTTRRKEALAARRGADPAVNVLVDTSVWSLALRRPKTAPLTAEQKAYVIALADFVRAGQALLMGPIRQELLCGIRQKSQFDALRKALDGFADVRVTRLDYELAAQSFNTCRAQGIQGSNTDFLICAVAINHGLPILSTDRDFANYQQCLPIQIAKPRR